MVTITIGKPRHAYESGLEINLPLKCKSRDPVIKTKNQRPVVYNSVLRNLVLESEKLLEFELEITAELNPMTAIAREIPITSSRFLMEVSKMKVIKNLLSGAKLALLWIGSFIKLTSEH